MSKNSLTGIVGGLTLLVGSTGCQSSIPVTSYGENGARITHYESELAKALVIDGLEANRSFEYLKNEGKIPFKEIEVGGVVERFPDFSDVPRLDSHLFYVLHLPRIDIDGNGFVSDDEARTYRNWNTNALAEIQRRNEDPMFRQAGEKPVDTYDRPLWKKILPN